MIKVAVQFSGMTRCLDECYESHLRFFENRNDIQFDFFMHTWDETFYDEGVRQRIERNRGIKVSDDIIHTDKLAVVEKLNSIYNPISLMVESQDDSCQMNRDVKATQTLHNLTSAEPWLNLFTSDDPKRIRPSLNIPQTYSMSKVNDLCHEYSRSNNIEYRLTIRTRFDLMFSSSPQDREHFMESIERKIYDVHDNSISFSLHTDNKRTFVNDAFFLGPYQNMNFVLTELYRSKLKEIYSDDYTFLQEGFLMRVMNGYNRPNMRQSFDFNLNKYFIYLLKRKTKDDCIAH